MTLKQRLEALSKQNEEMLAIMRQLAKGGAKGAPKRDDVVEGHRPPPRRWNAVDRYFEIYLHGSGWIRDFDTSSTRTTDRPYEGAGGRR